MASSREEGRRKRHRRVRVKVRGVPERARLTVFRSHLQIYAQIIDDTSGTTLVSCSSLRFETPPPGEGVSRRIAQAKAVGQELATRAKAKGIEKVTFDRSGYRYHGRVAALAQGAREGGLVF